ncbi:MAG: putative colanic acid biosynthesis acetyltransferase [Acidobacteria bacterium]|nr:MAG: putative colanic acid biosynthesis acetyltransferase [Acidobacteriota bacterium]
MAENLDVAANRAAVKYSHPEIAKRVAWALAKPLFRWSPRVAFGWRNALLRLFGARVGRGVRIEPSVAVAMPWNLKLGDWSAVGANARLYSLGSITLGSGVTVSQGAHLCAGTHDYTDPKMPLLRPPVSVGDQAWICADAFVGPGVRVGEGAVIGARAVVVKDVEQWTVVAGNPARVVKRRTFGASR